MDRRRSLTLVAGIVLGAACRTVPASPAAPIVQPGAPGKPSQIIDARQAADLSQLKYTPAEIQFVQRMIGHHMQALEMTDLLASRTSRHDMQLLAKRIQISQADEIDMMREWLKSRGAALPDPHAHHAPDAALMPGMLTAAEMQRLSSATGEEFERLFLEFMIRHHDGALVMVEELFGAAGAGQQSDIYSFASDVEADQRMEIERMSAMLRERQR